MFTTPEMRTGDYNMKCVYNNIDFILKGFNVYGVTIFKVQPNRIPIDTNQKITVSGSNFINTGQLFNYVGAFLLIVKVLEILHVVAKRFNTL